MCQETGLLPISTLPLSNSPPTYMHAAHIRTHLTNIMTACHLWRFRPFTLCLFSEMWKELQNSSVCQTDPVVRQGQGLTLQFLPLSQPNSSSSENTHWEAGSCTGVLLQHSNIFCLLTSPTHQTAQWVHYYKCAACCALKHCSELYFKIY